MKVRDHKDIIIAKGSGEYEHSFPGSGTRTKILHPPIETSWELPERKQKKTSSLKSVMAYPLKLLGRSKSMQLILEGPSDFKDEQLVDSFREMLFVEGLLPPKHNDYHTLLRYMSFS